MGGKAFLALGLVVASGVVNGSAYAAGVDTTPPSVPANVHQVGPDQSWSKSSVAWSASTDNSGAVSFYWVRNVSNGVRTKPRATSAPVVNLLSPFCEVPVGTVITVTVQAVDAAGNVSAPSTPITIKIN
ncbi:hypothetical protein [Kribbella sp. NPDC055071]